MEVAIEKTTWLECLMWDVETYQMSDGEIWVSRCNDTDKTPCMKCH